MANLTLTKLPDVGRIQGLRAQAYSDHRRSVLFLQYTDRSGVFYEVQMPFLDGMYLLNLLKASQKDLGFEMPDDPYVTP